MHLPLFSAHAALALSIVIAPRQASGAEQPRPSASAQAGAEQREPSATTKASASRAAAPLSPSAAPADDSKASSLAKGYAQALVARAGRLGLWRRTQWLRLGHWRPRLLGGYTSEVDGQAFFLAAEGKRDPAAELRETLRGFVLGPGAVRPLERDNPAAKDVSDHPICRFPARFAWLAQQLQIDPRRLKMPTCPGFMRFWKRIDPTSVALVFSSYYLNSPASAFGHTLLRIGKRGNLAVGKKGELLDYGVNFSADVDTGNALLYAFKGLTGLFRGTFKLLPYYYKVREYNDYESRDLWEYELNLEPAAVSRLVLHLWELGQTHFDYYYLDENCSYHILALLDVSDPRLQLLSQVGNPVIPAETVKAVVSSAGLVKSIARRPSLRLQFRRRVAGLSGATRRLVARLAKHPDTPLPEDLSEPQRVQALDAALDLVDIHYAEELVHKTSPEGARRKQRLLERRAAIRVPSRELRLEAIQSAEPHRAHGARRVIVGAGWAERGGAFQRIAFRLALHDLADPAAGLPALSQIEFLSLDLRYRHERADLLLRDFVLFRVLSLSTLDRFDPQLSWKVDVGAGTIEDSGCTECVGPRLGGGFGTAVQLWSERAVAYAFAELRLRYAPGLDGLADAPFRVGVGPSAGLRLQLKPSSIALLTGQWFYLPAQDPLAEWEVGAIVRWGIAGDFALSAEGRYGPAGAEAQLGLASYF
jgi:hypothetical protein